ncbi:MAG: hypothetical protein GXY83_37845 [Rhodopirellula sp.]|nr:hypothetical protein [Rhodopirellula sp.]
MARSDRSAPDDSSRGLPLPRRSRKYGVGKEIGGAVYVHRRYQHVFGSAVEEAQKHLPPDFSYTVVKLNLANNSLSFVAVADFDTAPEPTIGAVVTVKTDGSCRRMQPPSDPFIYHHKWLFVKDDYDGFDVEESKVRSRAWMALADIDRTRIGKKSYWQSKVVPRLL